MGTELTKETIQDLPNKAADFGTGFALDTLKSAASTGIARPLIAIGQSAAEIVGAGLKFVDSSYSKDYDAKSKSLVDKIKATTSPATDNDMTSGKHYGQVIGNTVGHIGTMVGLAMIGSKLGIGRGINQSAEKGFGGLFSGKEAMALGAIDVGLLTPGKESYFGKNDLFNKAVDAGQAALMMGALSKIGSIQINGVENGLLRTAGIGAVLGGAIGGANRAIDLALSENFYQRDMNNKIGTDDTSLAQYLFNGVVDGVVAGAFVPSAALGIRQLGTWRNNRAAAQAETRVPADKDARAARDGGGGSADTVAVEASGSGLGSLLSWRPSWPASLSLRRSASDKAADTPVAGKGQRADGQRDTAQADKGQRADGQRDTAQADKGQRGDGQRDKGQRGDGQRDTAQADKGQRGDGQRDKGQRGGDGREDGQVSGAAAGLAADQHPNGGHQPGRDGGKRKN